MNQIDQIDQIKTSDALPDDAEYLFDELDQVEGSTGEASENAMTCATTVYKTRSRKVVTLKHGSFSAREMVRRKTNTSLNLGRLPSRILRQTDFVENVIEVYDNQCRAKTGRLRKVVRLQSSQGSFLWSERYFRGAKGDTNCSTDS